METGDFIYNNDVYRKVLDKHFAESTYIHQGFFKNLDFEFPVSFRGTNIIDSSSAYDCFDDSINQFFVELFNRAQELYIEELVKPLQLNENHRVLDLGCGVGSSAIWLAKKYGCKVHGIDISRENIETANRYAESEGLQDKVSFECKDALDLDFGEGSFDHIFSVECFYFIDDKPTLARNLNRFLKDGGTFAISDYVLKDGFNWFTRVITLCQYGSMNIMHNGSYKPLLESAGFSNTELRDVTHETVIPSLNLFKLDEFRSVQEEYVALEGKAVGFLTTSLVKKYALPVAIKNLYGLNFIYCTK